MKTDSIEFRDEAFWQWMRTFDAFDYEYNFRGFSPSDDETFFGPKDADNYEERKREYSAIKADLSHYSERNNDATRNYSELARLHKALIYVYGDDLEAQFSVEVFDFVHQHLISDFIGIPCLRSLFSDRYVVFEWEMHTELIRNKSEDGVESNFYRDHFIHQVRNVFELAKLLELSCSANKTIMDSVLELLSTDTIVGSFFQSAVRTSSLRINRHQLKRLKSLFSIQLEDQEEQLNESFDRLLTRYLSEYIVKSALFLAGIFHDLGYPIAHVRRNSLNLDQMLSTSRYFTHPTEHHIDLSAILANTLLYKVVGKNEVEAQVEVNDHGCLSAVAFLAFMYETDAISSLSEERKAAVELAALIMYDHTLSYKLLHTKEASKTRYYRPVNAQNPLSYLFRFADDIQEWDRLYFKITKNPNQRICNKCKMPIISFKPDLPLGIVKDIFNPNASGHTYKRVSLCKCVFEAHDELTDRTELAQKLIDVHPDIGETAIMSDINYTRINQMNACRRVHIIALSDEKSLNRILPPVAEVGVTPKTFNISHRTGKYVVHLDYDPFRQLQFSFFAPDFSIYRGSEINGYLKKYLENQYKFPQITIFTCLTPNPLTLKIKILERYLRAFNCQNCATWIKIINNTSMTIRTPEEVKSFYSRKALAIVNSLKLFDPLNASVTLKQSKTIIVQKLILYLQMLHHGTDLSRYATQLDTDEGYKSNLIEAYSDIKSYPDSNQKLLTNIFTTYDKRQTRVAVEKLSGILETIFQSKIGSRLNASERNTLLDEIVTHIKDFIPNTDIPIIIQENINFIARKKLDGRRKVTAQVLQEMSAFLVDIIKELFPRPQTSEDIQDAITDTFNTEKARCISKSDNDLIIDLKKELLNYRKTQLQKTVLENPLIKNYSNRHALSKCLVELVKDYYNSESNNINYRAMTFTDPYVRDRYNKVYWSDKKQAKSLELNTQYYCEDARYIDELIATKQRDSYSVLDCHTDMHLFMQIACAKAYRQTLSPYDESAT